MQLTAYILLVVALIVFFGHCMVRLYLISLRSKHPDEVFNLSVAEQLRGWVSIIVIAVTLGYLFG